LININLLSFYYKRLFLSKKINYTRNDQICHLHTHSMLRYYSFRGNLCLPKKSSTSRYRIIDKMVRIFRRLRKILSRELRNAAKWRRGVRCRGGFAEMSLDCRLENTRDAVRDAGEMRGQGRLQRNQGRGYGRWNSPYPREPRVLTLLSVFPPGMLPVVSLKDLVEAERSRCCQRRSCCRG